MKNMGLIDSSKVAINCKENDYERETYTTDCLPEM